MTQEKKDELVAALARYRGWTVDDCECSDGEHNGMAVECDGEDWVVYASNGDAHDAAISQIVEYLDEDIERVVPRQYMRYIDTESMARDEILSNGEGLTLASYDGETVELESRDGGLLDGVAYRRA